MGERMTGVSLPGCNYPGLADYGRKEPSEMIHQIRELAAREKKIMEEILAASDEDFRVETYRGIFVQKSREVLQFGRAALSSEARNG